MNLLKTKYAAAFFVAAAVVAGCSKSAETEASGTDLTAQALAAAEASGFRPPEGGDGGVLHIYTWSDYIAPDVLASFEKALGVTVVIDTFDSNESMYAKLKAGATGYDIIMPSSYQIVVMAREKMIDAIDHTKVPNMKKNFASLFASQVLDTKFTYSVPYAVTYTGFCYLKSKIPEDVDIGSWAVLCNPALRGRVSLLDDHREVIGAALMYLGYSINSTDPKEIDAAVAQVLKWRANIRKFDGESYKTEVPAGATWIGHGYSSDATQLIVGDEAAGAPARDDIGFALPKEGFSIGFDEMVVAKDARRKDLAYAFINYIYDGDVAAANMNFICCLNPVQPGLDKTDPEYLKLLLPDEATLKHGQVLISFDDKPAVMDLYNKAWDKIKAAEAR